MGLRFRQIVCTRILFAIETIRLDEYNINVNEYILGGIVVEYLSTAEISKIWNVSPRRVQILCKEGRVEGAVFKGVWLIPAEAKKPEDPRKTRRS